MEDRPAQVSTRRGSGTAHVRALRNFIRSLSTKSRIAAPVSVETARKLAYLMTASRPRSFPRQITTLVEEIERLPDHGAVSARGRWSSVLDLPPRRHGPL